MTEVVQVKIDGKEFGFHFNNYALIELGKVLEVDPMEGQQKLFEIAADDQFMGLAVILYCGFVGYFKSKFKLNHGLTIEQVTEMIGRSDLNGFNDAYDAFKQSTGVSEFLEKQVVTSEVSPEEEKKK